MPHTSKKENEARDTGKWQSQHRKREVKKQFCDYIVHVLPNPLCCRHKNVPPIWASLYLFSFCPPAFFWSFYKHFPILNHKSIKVRCASGARCLKFICTVFLFTFYLYYHLQHSCLWSIECLSTLFALLKKYYYER